MVCRKLTAVKKPVRLIRPTSTGQKLEFYLLNVDYTDGSYFHEKRSTEYVRPDQ
jgi:hypothetical protein